MIVQALKTRRKCGLEHFCVRRRPGGKPHEALLIAGSRVLPCAIGRSGMSVFKREGDGATPARRQMTVLNGYWRADRTHRPRTMIAMRTIRLHDGWCDCPSHAAYNRPVALPFASSHERMMRDDPLYDVVVVLDWNVTSRSRNRGSAIFLHCAKPGMPATAGCIALKRRDLHWLLAHMARKARFVAA